MGTVQESIGGLGMTTQTVSGISNSSTSFGSPWGAGGRSPEDGSQVWLFICITGIIYFVLEVNC